MEFKIQIVPFGAPAHRQDIAALDAGGRPVPHQYLPWDMGQGSDGREWCRVLSDDGRLMTGFVFRLFWTRALPGARSIRIERIGRDLHAPILDVIGDVVLALARRFRAIYRVHVELFDEDAERRSALARSLRRVGGEEQLPPRGYAETLLFDTARSPADMLASLSSSTRRDIRSVEKSGVKVAPITDKRYLPRLEELYQSSFHRTGSDAPPVRFDAILTDVVREDASSALLGAFWPGREPLIDLVAFVWGRWNGDHATYDVGASDRSPDIGRTPLSYALIWNLLVWTSARSGRWFDLGGVIPIDAPDDHPLKGISAFKLRFSQTRAAVGAEFRLEPNPVLSSIASLGRRALAAGR